MILIISYAIICLVATQSVTQQIETRLREHGIRFTAARRSVIEALSEAPGPRSVVELQHDLESAIPLSSLYRSLAVLQEAGIIEPHLGLKGIARFELAEWLTGHHHHFVCVECGYVEDFNVPPELETRLLGIIQEIAHSVGCENQGHTLEIAGRCHKCQ